MRARVSESDDVQDAVEDWTSLLRLLGKQNSNSKTLWGEDSDEILDTDYH